MYTEVSDGAPSARKFRLATIILSVVAVAFLITIIVLAVKLSKAGDSGSSSETPQPGQSEFVKHFAHNVKVTMDTTVNPCEDFYAYACGGWIKNFTLPADQNRWTRSFNNIDDSNLDLLKKVLEEDWPVIGQFYQSCNDLDAIEAKGADPLKTYLQQLDAVTTKDQLFDLAAKLFKDAGITTFFSLSVGADSRNPLKNIVLLGQGGTALDRDYYLNAEYAALKANYTKHITNQFKNAGVAEQDARTEATAVVEFETLLANASLPNAAMRDPVKTYNKHTLTELQDLTRDLKWTDFFTTAGFNTSIFDSNVDNPDFFQSFASFWNASSLDQLKSYMKFNIINDLASVLSSAFRDENFDFFGRQLSGQQAPPPRWKSCLRNTDSSLGELLGRYYVDRGFPGDSKSIALDLVRRIEKAFQDNVPSLTWMDTATRKAALKKLSMITNMIGYPDQWTDYSSLRLSRDDYFDNSIQLTQFAMNKMIGKLGRPVNRAEWLMSPPTVNAYYEPTANQMVFPAGIIQPTFFSHEYPPAVNFGGIGMVMGHELTHGFDDEGSQFDGTGNLTNWWTPQVLKNFQEKTQCLVDQYSKYTVGKKHVDGRLTLGENIADNGGIKMAFRAYRAYVKEKGEPKSIVDTLTNDQLFFISFAQGWCEVIRPQFAEYKLKVDPHSPAKYRVLGPLSNLDDFATTFNCAAGTQMNPKNKCHVW